MLYNLLHFLLIFGVNGDLEMFSWSWSINNKACHFLSTLFVPDSLFPTIYHFRFTLYLSITVILFTDLLLIICLSPSHSHFFVIILPPLSFFKSLSLSLHTASTLYPSFSILSLSLEEADSEKGRGGGDEMRELLGDGCWETDVGGVAGSQSQEWRCLGDRGFTLSYRIWRKMGGLMYLWGVSSTI